MAKEINGIRILGIGGICGWIVRPVLQYATFTHRQDEPLDVTLVDGDTFEAKNLERQACTTEDLEKNKAQAMLDSIRDHFDMLDISVFPEYITPENIASVIHEGDVVLMGFDNFKSRKHVADYCSTLDNIILISGGNEWTDGNVQVFIKENGERLTANIDEYHPEIAEPADKSPGELGCADLIASAPQLLAMNMMVASIMFNAMCLALRRDEDEAFQTVKQYGEVYCDITTNESVARVRNPRTV